MSVAGCKWAALTCQPREVAVWCRRFNSRVWAGVGSKKKAGMSSMLWFFDLISCSSASVLIRAGSVMEVSTSEGPEMMEDRYSGIEGSDSWLGGRSIASREFVKALEGQERETYQRPCR